MTVAVKNNNKRPLVVPSAIRRQARFKSGQELEIKASSGVITILPKLPSADVEYTPAQRRIVDAKLGEALGDIAGGHLQGPFPDHKSFIESLHKEAKKLRAAKKNSRSR